MNLCSQPRSLPKEGLAKRMSLSKRSRILQSLSYFFLESFDLFQSGTQEVLQFLTELC
jgi:hypothetical protein